MAFSWLLTLDQDTSLPPDFLLRLAAHAVQQQPASRIAAIVPQIADQGRLISPLPLRRGFPAACFSPPAPTASPPASPPPSTSGSLLRVEALHELGGYDLRFPLHNSDTRLYQRLDAAGKRVLSSPAISTSITNSPSCNAKTA